MSTRWAGLVVILVATAGPAAAAPPGPVDVGASSETVDLEGVLAPRGLSEPRPAGTPVARLVWIDPSRAAVGVGAIARAEAGSLLKRMDVSVEWRSGEAGEIARPGEVRVILVDRAAARATGEAILGSTLPRFEGEPHFWVHLPNVRAAIGLRPHGPLAPVEASAVRALGVALGRVVAHELVHVLAPAAPHGKGLMSEKLSPIQLTAARLAVEPATGVAVRAALRGEPSLAPADADVLAATASGRKRER